jgi:excisionase family DNA binding protein
MLSDNKINVAKDLQTCQPRASLIISKTHKVMSQEQLQEVADLITANTLFCTKEVLTSDEAAKYMGISKSYLYKLTMRGEIPHYKPMGKMCYFNRAELEQWLQQNRVATSTEIADRANLYCMKGGKA